VRNADGRDDWRDEWRVRSSVTNSDTNPDAMIADAICTDWRVHFSIGWRARLGDTDR
jgi:hypothetical protein